MKVQTYNALQLFLRDGQAAQFEKVCMAYRHIFFRLFAEFEQAHLQGMTADIDCTAIVRKLKHEDASLDTDVFSKYNSLVVGAMLKVQSVFAPVRNHMDVRVLRAYLEKEKFAQAFALPIESASNGAIEVPYLGRVVIEGRARKAEFVEFVRSRHHYQTWFGKAYYSETMNPNPKTSGIITLRPIKEAPLGMYTLGQEGLQINGLAEYARFVDLKSQSHGSALKRMRNSDEHLNHDFNQAKKDSESRAVELELRAMQYAPMFARQVLESFEHVGFCFPVAVGMQTMWDYMNLDILFGEVERLMLQAAVERKQLKSPLMKFYDMAFCPHCKNASKSKMDNGQVVCGNRNHQRVDIYDAVAHNTMLAMQNKL